MVNRGGEDLSEIEVKKPADILRLVARATLADLCPDSDAALLAGADRRLTCGETDWHAVWDLALQCKISTLVQMGLDKMAVPVPEVLHDTMAKQRMGILRWNLSNLAHAFNASALVARAGIDVLVIKGVSRSHAVYGAYDMRIASDIDLLVPRLDYEAASEVLCQHGFRRGVSQSSRWWHHYLGESPFLPRTAGMTVDLHHRLQQPGGPPPRHLAEFFAHSTASNGAAGADRTAPDAKLPQLSPEYAFLVTLISFSKAVRAGEPWISHAHEIATVLLRMQLSARQHMLELARHQGLDRLLMDAVDHSQRLFAIDLGLGASNTMPDATHGEDALLLSATGISSAGEKPFRRTRLQWRWTHGDGLARSARFGQERARLASSDMRRAVEMRFPSLFLADQPAL
ncbi:nucleotidyltransferase family protein [Croceicoccus sp. F390]|uniref:Nucleotidyltransferase family protein n=1 Tax=Croceicoccus esteveae TaxID=3075597 RepID=A0ABU2ZLB0_9SPHN|nr:nucleotidyltransferase family protein [Croceicoccus sp. F390]MDT0577011.1 nucleotidyltransferase family protein [Croceicoccus sp. F390]